MYRSYRHVGDATCDIQINGGCTGVYRCIAHRHMGDVLVAYRCMGGCTGVVQMYST